MILQLTTSDARLLAIALSDLQAIAIRHADTLAKERRAPNAEQLLRDRATLCCSLVEQLTRRTV